MSISSEVLPEYREYERLSTTILNSYIGPVVSDYINRFENNLKNNGIDVNPYISQSSGGTMSTSTTKKIRYVLLYQVLVLGFLALFMSPS